MTNKHFCQGPKCHEQTTQDRFLKSRGVVRGRYAYATIDSASHYSNWNADKYFCSQRCKFDWLSTNMENIEQVDRLSLSDTDERAVVMRNKLLNISTIGERELLQELKLKGLTIGQK